MLMPAANAAEPLRVYQLESGYYSVQGTAIVRVQIVYPDSPVPPAPIVPDDDRVATLRAAAEAATADPARAATAANLGAVAGLMTSQIQAGSLKEYQTIAAAYDYLSSQMIGRQAPAWKPFQALVGNHLAAMAQEGAQPEEYAGFFDDVGKALEQSVEEGQQVMAIDMAVILKLLMWFMENILPLIIR
jgi:hypothetical protein